MSESDSDPLVRVAVCPDAMTAHLKAALLRSEGIESHLRGEGLGPYQMTVGRLAEVEIWVRDADSDDARQVLEMPAELSESPRQPPSPPMRAVAIVTGVVVVVAIVAAAVSIF